MTKIVIALALMMGLVGCGESSDLPNNTKFKGVWKINSSLTTLEISETTVALNQAGQVTKFLYTVVSRDHAVINAMVMPDGTLGDRGPYTDLYVGTNSNLILIYEKMGYEFTWVKGL